MITTRRAILIANVARLPATVFGQPAAPTPATASFVGSTACKTCHPSIYERWSKTRVANVVRARLRRRVRRTTP
jgi:hypothetical protein